MYKISASLLLRNAQYHCLNSTGTVLKLTFELDLLCHTLLINIYTPAGMLAKQFDRARIQISSFSLLLRHRFTEVATRAADKKADKKCFFIVIHEEKSMPCTVQGGPLKTYL